MYVLKDFHPSPMVSIFLAEFMFLALEANKCTHSHEARERRDTYLSLSVFNWR